MKAQVEIVSPAMAKEYLERALPNRKLSNYTVQQYASDMKSGRWENTGQGLIFDEFGHLLDGQHRCHALILSQQTIAMMVVRGVPAKMFKLIDGGKQRLLQDVISIDGYKNSIIMAGVARGAYAYISGASLKYCATKATLEEFIQRHPHIADESELNGNMSKTMPRVPMATVMFLANDRKLMAEEVKEFIAGVHTGERLWKGDPRLTLREWLANKRSPTGTFRRRMETQHYFAGIARAWNAFAAGKELHQIRQTEKQTRATLPIMGFDPSLYPDVPDIRERTIEVQRSNLSQRNKVKPPLLVDTSVSAADSRET